MAGDSRTDPVYWIRHLPTGHERVLKREKLHWVPPDVDWSMIPTNVMEVTKNSPTKPQFEMPAPEPMDYDELLPSTKELQTPGIPASDMKETGGKFAVY